MEKNAKKQTKTPRIINKTVLLVWINADAPY